MQYLGEMDHISPELRPFLGWDAPNELAFGDVTIIHPTTPPHPPEDPSVSAVVHRDRPWLLCFFGDGFRCVFRTNPAGISTKTTCPNLEAFPPTNQPTMESWEFLEPGKNTHSHGEGFPPTQNTTPGFLQWHPQ